MILSGGAGGHPRRRRPPAGSWRRRSPQRPRLPVGGTIPHQQSGRVHHRGTPVPLSRERISRAAIIPINHVNADDPEACWRPLAVLYRGNSIATKADRPGGLPAVGPQQGDACFVRPAHVRGDQESTDGPEPYAAALREGPLQAEDAEAGSAAAYQRLVESAGIQGERGGGAGTRCSRLVGVREWSRRCGRNAARAQPATRGAPGFTVNPKPAAARSALTAVGARPGIDWGHAEALALASLLLRGSRSGRTGQDTERGTFSHRHLVHAVTGETCSRQRPRAGSLEVCTTAHLRARGTGVQYTRPPRRRHWCCGRRTLGISSTAPRSLSTSSSPWAGSHQSADPAAPRI